MVSEERKYICAYPRPSPALNAESGPELDLLARRSAFRTRLRAGFDPGGLVK